MEHVRLVHVLAWRFAKVSNNAETARFLRQITSDVMSHAQIPAMQWFWGMHGLVLETSIWLLAESTRSQLCDARPKRRDSLETLHTVLLMIVCCIVFLIVKSNDSKSQFLRESNSLVLLRFSYCWPLVCGWNSSKCGDNQVPISVQPSFKCCRANGSAHREPSMVRNCRR